MYKPALVAGILTGLLAVVLGAFGAHGLKAIVTPDQLAIYEKAVSYQFYHTFALLATGILFGSFPFKIVKTAYFLFISGIICFSGSLYLMVLLTTQHISIGPAGVITPIGGLLLIAGWASLLTGILKKN